MPCAWNCSSDDQAEVQPFLPTSMLVLGEGGVLAFLISDITLIHGSKLCQFSLMPPRTLQIYTSTYPDELLDQDTVVPIFLYIIHAQFS